MSPMSMLTPVTGSLYAAQIPIPYPMKTVTVLLDVASPVTLIDAAVATEEAEAALDAVLTEAGLSWERIERLILTHHHPDHYGMAGLIEERSGAQVQLLDIELARGAYYWTRWDEWYAGHEAHFLAHGAPKDALETLHEESRRTLARVRPAARHYALKAGERIRLSGKAWEVLHLPGHADGHLGLYEPGEELLIAGDAVLPRVTPNVGLYGYTGADPLGEYLHTLQRLQALAPRRSVVGHFGPFLDDTAGRAAEIAAHHHERLDALTALLRDSQGEDAYALSWELFGRKLSPTARRFALAETLAHLEYLRQRGGLSRFLSGGVWKYSALSAPAASTGVWTG